MARSETVAVIGAGIGGLAAALRLAAAGYAVTILERHSWPGGKMRTLPSPAGPVDAGPTVLTMRQVFDDLFAAAGARTEDHVTLIREPLLARHFWPDGSALDLWDDPARSTEAVNTFAGARAAREFERFSARAKRLFDGFDAPIMQAADPTLGRVARHVLRNPKLLLDLGVGTLAQTLRGAFTDPRLRQLFGRYATYVGGSPYSSPAVLALIWHAEASGVWRVEGGMHRLARAITDLAEAKGARIRLETGAARIEIQGERPTAVHTNAGERLPVDHVVFNGDPRALTQGLLGPGVATAVTLPNVEPRSLSALVGAFSATVYGPELAYHNVAFGADPEQEFRPLERGHYPQDPTVYICAEDRGDGPVAATGPERFETIVNAPPLPQNDPEESQSCLTRASETLARCGLTFHPAPGPETVTTPQDFDRLFPASGGSLYGRSPHGRLAAFSRPRARTAMPGLVLAGGGAHPGAGVPMAALSGRHAAETIMSAPNFDIHVGPDGYAWWYVDGVSDDGSRAISIIGFIGSVFSPWYRWSGRKNPANHCCLNVATYGRGGRWTMTDRGAQALRLSRDALEIGPSAMRWDGDRLVVEIDELAWPHMHRLQGTVTIIPEGLTQVELPLTDDGAHVWRPFAPQARIEVALNRDGWRWSGHGYFDSNFGTRALETDFSYWTWGRFPSQNGALAFYDADRRDGTTLATGVRFDRGQATEIEAPPKARMARSLWTVRRETRADPGTRPRQVKSMLDAPFYCRSVVETRIDGETLTGVHEALDLNRFASPLLKPMLAVKVPRRARWTRGASRV